MWKHSIKFPTGFLFFKKKIKDEVGKGWDIIDFLLKLAPILTP